MRELTLIGLDVDGHHIICEGGDPADKFLIRVDDRLRAAVRGERPRPEHRSDSEARGVLSPREIQARIRAGASVEEVLAYAADARRDVDALESLEADGGSLEADLADALLRVRELADEVTRGRELAAERLSEVVGTRISIAMLGRSE